MVLFLIIVGIPVLMVTLIGTLLVSEFRRSLHYHHADAWLDPQYLRALPNVMHLLRSKGFATAWPRHCTPWSMTAFERRLERTVKPLLRRRTDDFVEQHLSAWIWIHAHQADVKRLIASQEEHCALRILSRTNDPKLRATILAFLNARLAHLLKKPVDPSPLKRMNHLHSIMREHGYSMSPEFEASDRIGQMAPNQLLRSLSLVAPRDARIEDLAHRYEQ